MAPDSFPFSQSILFLFACVVGGAGWVFGPAVGAAITVVLPELLSQLAEYRLLFFGALLLAVLWLAPEGVLGTLARVVRRTDLFLTGRDSDANVPRGVTPAHRLRARGVNANISTNNVLNPFTPFGDCSLIRMINLYANVTQVAATAELAGCLDMVTSASARLLNLKDYGIAVGNPADLVMLDCATKGQAVCEIAQPLFGLKRGVRTFDKPAAMLHKPN